jgi:DNA primase
MTETPSPSEDRYAHLRDYAARRKQATLDRLNQAITQLEQEKRPVTTFTIKEVSGLDYMAYHRNTEALALFRRHITHLRKERQKEQSKRRGTKRHPPGQQETMVSSRDPLLNYKNPAYNRVNLKVNGLSHRITRETDQKKRATMLQHLHTLQEERERTPSRKPAKRLTFSRYADDWVILLYEYAKDEAKAIKATIAEWLKTTLKLTLSTEKTLITHWTDKVTFLGFALRGIKSHVNGARRAPRLIIPHDTEEGVKHTVAKLTRQSFIDPGDMIDSVNLVLKGWMNYYCYATNPHRVIARVLHHAFWCLVRYLNKRRKQRGAKKVMRQYYRSVKGKKTLAYTSPLTGRQTSLVRSPRRKSLYKLKCEQVDVDTRKYPWMNYSASVGRSPWQREETKVS